MRVDFERGRSVSVERLAEALRQAAPAVVLTGAGVSTESGIPDFRSPTGIWAKLDPLEYGSIDAFRRDPERVWEFYGARYRMLSQAEPNAAHRAIAALERRGFVHTVITQNIDMLHTRAGSRDVIEVHGSIRTATCPACGRIHTLDEVLALVEAGVPRCLDCGAVPKPDVVFFGELLPPGAMERASELAAAARLLLVVGARDRARRRAGRDRQPGADRLRRAGADPHRGQRGRGAGRCCGPPRAGEYDAVMTQGGSR